MSPPCVTVPYGAPFFCDTIVNVKYTTTLTFLIAVIALWAVVIYTNRDGTRENLRLHEGKFLSIKDSELETMFLQTEPARDLLQEKIDEVALLQMRELIRYDYEGALRDPTGMRRNLGTVEATFQNGTYNLRVTVADLPDLPAGGFYEGWLVRSAPFHTVNIGPLERIGGILTNLYRSRTDLSDHEFYVLTHERNERNPLPYEFLYEARLEKK